jgi:very-short-patch-repair endonuclease
VTQLRTSPTLAPGTVKRARRLRRDATEAETVLWYALRERLGATKFRRQVPFGDRYYADFVSHEARLIVEVDGSQHAEAKDRDEARTRFLNGEGYKVLRFWNNDVLQNLEGVLAVIAAALPSPLVGEGGSKSRIRGARQGRARASGSHPHPTPSPQGGGSHKTTSGWSQ